MRARELIEALIQRNNLDLEVRVRIQVEAQNGVAGETLDTHIVGVQWQNCGGCGPMIVLDTEAKLVAEFETKISLSES